MEKPVDFFCADLEGILNQNAQEKIHGFVHGFFHGVFHDPFPNFPLGFPPCPPSDFPTAFYKFFAELPLGVLVILPKGSGV